MTRQEFRNLVEEEGKEVYSFCFYLTQKKEYAEDLYQETMLKAMEQCSKIDKFQNPKSFLIAIGIGIWKNTMRKNARRKRIAPSSELKEEFLDQGECSYKNNLEENIILKEKLSLVRTIVSSLEEKYRLPVYMFYTAEMSIQQISKILHIPNGTVKSRLHKAKAVIRKKLEEYGYE